MNEQISINWYRTKVDKQVMSELMRKSDAKAFRQVFAQFGLYAVTGTLAFLAFKNIQASNWLWSVPLLLGALFLHGTFASFFGGTAVHELSHKTPFKTPFWNEFFLHVYSFLSWADPVGYRVSHVKHHQVTVWHDYDGEVVLPQGLDWHGVKFVVMQLTCNPRNFFDLLRKWAKMARGDISEGNGMFTPDWTAKILPESNFDLRRRHRNWARIVFGGHLLLAVVFVATGNWILIPIVTFGCHYCPWLQTLTGAPQHCGLTPNVPDWRLCCRTYTCNWFPAFLYWNMQYHVEHHMFPAVPFYNLPRLRAAIEHDLPPAPNGLWATYKEIIPILRRQRLDPGYFFTPQVPGGFEKRAAA
jgi:fatty acid desaturase